MSEDDWNFPDGRFVAYVLAAVEGSEGPLYIVLNGADIAVEITGPQWPDVGQWQQVLDTSDGAEIPVLKVGEKAQAQARTCSLSPASHERSTTLRAVAHRERRDISPMGARRPSAWS